MQTQCKHNAIATQMQHKCNTHSTQKQCKCNICSAELELLYGRYGTATLGGHVIFGGMYLIPC